MSLTVGPAVAGAIVAVLGPRVGLLIDCVTFWVCGAAMLAVAIRHRDMDELIRRQVKCLRRARVFFGLSRGLQRADSKEFHVFSCRGRDWIWMFQLPNRLCK